YPMATRRRPERRTSDAAKAVELVVGALRIDGKRREAWVAGRRLALTPTEFSILMMLATDPGRVVRREELVVSLWGRAAAVQSHTLDVHVARLRRRLVDAGGSPLITTVYAVGYRLREDGPAS